MSLIDRADPGDDRDDVPLPLAERMLLRCIEAPADEQQELLASLCREHPDQAELLQRRWRLLAETGLLAESRSATTQRSFGAFQIRRRLAAGEVGAVYLATTGEGSERCLLQVPWPDCLQPGTLRRFRDECELWATLRHPGLGLVTEVGEVAGVPFAAVQLTAAMPLSAWIERARLQREPRIADWPPVGADRPSGAWTARALRLLGGFEAITRALHCAHASGLVHRGLWPAVVMVRADGTAFVTGFALARGPGESTADTAADPAALACRAPERQGAAAVGPAADVYSLGAMLLECLHAEAQPFDCDPASWHRRVLRGRRLRQSLRALGLRPLGSLLRQACALAPAARHPSALELAEDLQRLRRGEPIHSYEGWWQRLRERWLGGYRSRPEEKP